MELASLLGSMGRSVKEAREMGRKFSIVDGIRSQGKKGYVNMASLGDAWPDDGDGRGQELMDAGYL